MAETMDPDKGQQNVSGATSWLKKLSQESWQAELVVSGIAIYGSLQLPDVLHYISDWVLPILKMVADGLFIFCSFTSISARLP